MKRMVLGKTGIEAVRMGFGGIPIQRVSEAQAIEVVLYALEKGMDFIDTSRMYTTSETRIGKALKETDKKVAVATKSFARSADGIQKDVETSLKELQLELYRSVSMPRHKQRGGIPAGHVAGRGFIRIAQSQRAGIDRPHRDYRATASICWKRSWMTACLKPSWSASAFLSPPPKKRFFPKPAKRMSGLLP